MSIKERNNIRFVFEISNIRKFSRYSIRCDIRKFAAIKKTNIVRTSNIFRHVFRRKVGAWRSFNSSNYERDYNRQTTPKISYMYTYAHTRLQNKFINFAKLPTNLAANAVSCRLLRVADTVRRSLYRRGVFASSVTLIKVRVSGKFRINKN